MQTKRKPAIGLAMFVTLGLVACVSTPQLPKDGFVGVPGGRVAFRVIGNRGGTPVLMIHGGPGANGCSIPSTMGGVAASRPVVTYDQLGSGNSDRMLDLEREAVLPRFVAEVSSVRKHLGLEKVHLVGHSWGAAIALEYILTGDSAGVLSVSFVGPLLSTPRSIRDANSLVALLPQDAQTAIQVAKATGKFDTPEFKAANELFEAQFFLRTPADQRRLPACDSTPVRFNAELHEHMWGPSKFVATGTLRDFDRVERLPELHLPVMFIVGEFDEVRPATVEEYRALVPGSIVKVIPDAAHRVNVDQAATYNKVLAGFFESVERR